jgi:tRNA U34 5-methylaminomethyl-2-thiouridine-forming methyltransferase MnmC
MTADGTPTLERTGPGWSYRSRHGAWAEAQQIFVEGAGLAGGTGPRRVLELGFGAGTNFAATLVARRGLGVVRYHAVDRDPVAAGDLPVFDAAAHLHAVHATETGRSEDADVRLQLQRADFLEADVPVAAFDAIYFDPFGPTEEPDSWSVAAFVVARRALAPSGRLVTYSAAGWIRRHMAAAGLFVATVAGPPGKREFSIAARESLSLAGLRIRNAPP